MSQVLVSVDIDAPPDRVWKIVSDPRNLPRWDRRVVEVRGVPAGGLRKGSVYTSGVRFMGATLHGTSKVLELRPREYSKIELDGPVEGLVETWLEPLDGGRTRLTHQVTYRFRGGPLGELAASAVRLLGGRAILRRGIQAQKRHVEEERRKAG